MSLPLIWEVEEAPEPEHLFGALAREPWVVWFDTAMDGGPWGRFSFLALDPFRVLRGRSGRSEWIDRQGIRETTRDPLGELNSEIRRHHLLPGMDTPPFCGGAAGMFGYELAADLEAIPQTAFRDLPTPDLEVGFYDLVVGWDRVEGRCWIASTGSSAEEAPSVELAESRLAGARNWLNGGPPPSRYGLPRGSSLPLAGTSSPPVHPVPGAPGLASTFSRAGYEDAVRRAIEWIRAGDVYQVNLSQRFEVETVEEPARLYSRLREESPAPFGAFFSGDGFSVLSTSPERFLSLTRTGRVQTRPIKGTRRRGRDPVEDRRLAEELRRSVKDRAENLMIVDLLRNDLSRACQASSVKATALFDLESYRTVHHLVSTVEGRLREGLTASDLLRAAFPCGSVTGAPKVRAMEIIAELEPVARGPYCGALGYMGFGGDMDTSVSIRIAVAVDDRITFHAGGGVVADSDPSAEYEETLDKARGLFAAAGKAR